MRNWIRFCHSIESLPLYDLTLHYNETCSAYATCHRDRSKFKSAIECISHTSRISVHSPQMEGKKFTRKIGCTSEAQVAEKEFLLTQIYLVDFQVWNWSAKSLTYESSWREANKQETEGRKSRRYFSSASVTKLCAGQFDIVLFIVREHRAQLSCSQWQCEQ